jgi:hypothetical protein
MNPEIKELNRIICKQCDEKKNMKNVKAAEYTNL